MAEPDSPSQIASALSPDAAECVNELEATTLELVRAIESESPRIDEILQRRERAIDAVSRHLAEISLEAREQIQRASLLGLAARATVDQSRQQILRNLRDSQRESGRLRQLSVAPYQGEIVNLDA